MTLGSGDGEYSLSSWESGLLLAFAGASRRFIILNLIGEIL